MPNRMSYHSEQTPQTSQMEWRGPHCSLRFTSSDPEPSCPNGLVLSCAALCAALLEGDEGDSGPNLSVIG
jgi:hypothetical protein